VTEVPLWRLFAFMDDDEDGEQDESRTVSDWQVPDVLRWCVTRGYDHIYFRRVAGETVLFERAAPAPVRSHLQLVEGSSREPGDEAA